MSPLGPLSNQKLGNKYLLGELLGEGGFGAVYKAQNLLLNRLQAIKVILEKHFSDPKFRERFIREAQTLASLGHPNILPVYDFEIEGNTAYLVMPYISGGTLQSILRQRGPLSLQEAEHYLQQIAAALDNAHARNVVHLDLKPLNLLHQDGILLLSDFGLAHLMKEGGVEGGSSLRFGTPFYMAPEHLRGEPQQRSDIYALGVILFQMLAGHVPFSGPTPEAVMIKQLMESPPPLSIIRPDLPKSLDALLGKALAKNPEARYETAGKLLADYPSDRFSSVKVFANTYQQASHLSPTEYAVIHQTLILSSEEASKGTTRALKLPSGEQLPITISPGVSHGQIITISRLNAPTLILTIQISAVSASPPLAALPRASQPKPTIRGKDRSWGFWSLTFVILGFAGGLWTFGAFIIGLFLPIGVDGPLLGGRWHSSAEKAADLPLIALIWVACFGIALSIILWKRAGKRRKAPYQQ